MSLLELSLKRSYNSYDDDILRFFNDLLSESNIYFRAAAYFSSTSIKALSRGLINFIKKDGKIKMLVSVIVSKEDEDAIRRGLIDKENFLNNIITEDMLIETLQGENSAEALYELLLSGRLEMKFVISSKGIFHMKFGIVADSEGNMLSFSGSLNETEEGYIKNGEEFKVFRNWVEGEKDYVMDDLSKFNRYWAGIFPVKDTILSDVPESLRNKIKKVLEITGRKLNTQTTILRPYQKEAILKWKKNGYKGIIEMATGTGKTRTAIEIIKDLSEINEKLVIIIAVPTKELVDQWIKNLLENGISNAFEAKTQNINKIREELDLGSIYNKNKFNIVIVGTYSFFSRKAITERFNLGGFHILFLADEVHVAGAKSFSKVLLPTFDFRLGLSATPSRYFDEEGTEMLLEYFGGIVYTYTLKDAIEQGYLSPFYYYPFFVDLQPDEIEKYKKLTKKFANSLNKGVKDQEGINNGYSKQLLYQRARIIKKAKKKVDKLDVILEELIEKNAINHTIIYYEDRFQIKDSLKLFKEKNIRYGIISADTNKEDREKIFSEFDSGEIACICAMKIMDEGIDIPSIKNEIILSSSQNPRQIVQRVGRALRKYEGKETANIYEIGAVIIDLLESSVEGDLEKHIVEKEIKRMLYIAKAAKNELYCYNELYNIAKKFGITLNI